MVTVLKMKDDVMNEITSERVTSLTLKALLENPELLSPPKNSNHNQEKKDVDWEENCNVTAAFLGPTLWSKTLPYDGEFKLEYMDLDEFFSESETTNTTSGNSTDNDKNPEVVNQDGSSNLTRVKQASYPGKEQFDPTRRAFTEDELKPQPMFKKSKKLLVPTDMKDDKYWARRKKNNVAAKRSRDARRVKENQIVMRAAFLEKENSILRKEIDALRKENELLLARIRNVENH